jgi:hypothetical protein
MNDSGRGQYKQLPEAAGGPAARLKDPVDDDLAGLMQSASETFLRPAF